MGEIAPLGCILEGVDYQIFVFDLKADAEFKSLSADVAQLVEHHLAKVRVAGSNPVVRSNVLLQPKGIS